MLPGPLLVPHGLKLRLRGFWECLPADRKGSASGCMFSELNDPARQPSVYASLPSLARSQARLEARMESLLLFRRALSSPTMCRFIPAFSVPAMP
jgi:hypothetical protein